MTNVVNLKSANSVHLWVLDSTKYINYVDDSVSCLSAFESKKSLKFTDKKDQKLYILRQVMVRKVLAHYLRISCIDLEFFHNKFGKPFIKNSHLLDELQFNVSKSGSFVIIALTYNRSIGCDIEKHNNALDYLAIVKDYFSDVEIQKITKVSSSDVFFDYWVAKESYIKTVGLGLSLPLKKFTIDFGYGDDKEITIFDQFKQRIKPYSLKKIKLGGGYSAAVCVKGIISGINVYNADELMEN